MIYSLLNYMFMGLIYLFLLILMNMMAIAFLTLYERKILGYIQDRKGPNKSFFMGLMQPIMDAMKLLFKEYFILKNSNFYHYMICPILILILSFMLWFVSPFYFNLYNNNYSILFMLSVMSMSVFPMMISGWSSNSHYSMLGSIRSIAQSIAYEISLFLMLLILMILTEGFSFYNFMMFQKYIKFFIFLFPLYYLFILSMLVELNRTPFDLIEGESELISGFNTEYFSSQFTMIFMAEYLSISFMSMILSVMFFGYDLYSIKFLFMYYFHLMLIIWLRGVLPRMRYDELMMMCWKIFLPITLFYLNFIFLFKQFSNMML
uniref:NADH-ubiquinone oxidoreductase chain 1 n=1 Tax=Colletes gigas TaxID=935657 RepID=A0A0U1YGJ3_9HYME|nr:NADH dehydrogenase subunit 1 [Colletes gigas]